MKLTQFFCLFLLLIGNHFYSQNSEIGIFGGTSYYNGEINPSIQIANKIRPVGGLFYRKNLNKRYALRFGGNYGRLAAQENLNATAISKYRQLSFFSSIIDAYGILEFNFLPYQINNYTTSNFTPYVFIGLGAFRVNPKVAQNNVNDNSTGATISPSLPFGVGIKFKLVKNLGLSIEWTTHKTLTDRIDGLTKTYSNGYQLSNTRNKDWYSFFGITLNYKFLSDSDICPGVIN